MPLLVRESPLNSIWEGSGNVNALDVLRALGREPETLDALMGELALAAGACWAAYIIFSGRTGAAFPALDGLALAMVVATVVVLPFGLLDVARQRRRRVRETSTTHPAMLRAVNSGPCRSCVHVA